MRSRQIGCYSSRMLLVIASWVVLIILGMLRSPAMGGQPAAETVRQQWVMQASAGADARAVDALRGIAGADRRLLALHAYLRAGDALSERWSWSAQQIADYPATAEGRAAAADIDAVAAAFAAANPGFTLQVKREARSLEVQLAHWNANASVAAAAAALAAWLEQRFPEEAASTHGDALRRALIEWQPSTPVALAAPGLSPHGQARAFDFQIAHAGQIVAGADYASATERWDAAGWTQKLRAAVAATGDHFVGPLQAPYEPWHYAYLPGPAATAPAPPGSAPPRS